MVETRRSRPTHEDEAQRAMKQEKVSHAPQRGMERADNKPTGPQAWLPAPMLSGEPLRDDASLRDFNGGIGCRVALALEEALLLPNDMAELRNIRKNEVFLNVEIFGHGMMLILFFFFFLLIIIIYIYILFVMLLTLFF